MSRFAIKNPYFIIVCCLVIAIVGTTVLVRMPVDFVSAHKYSRCCGGHVLLRHAPRTD